MLGESSAEYKYILDLPGVPKSDIKVRLSCVCVDQDGSLCLICTVYAA